jgi:dolichyl-phosphate-mannose--protein O-mannosyl transferase
VAVGLLLVAFVATSWYFYPIWTATVIDQQEWSLRMRLPSWI